MGRTRPVVIGMAGGTASGKSTLARRFESELADLRVKVVGLDGYFKAVKPKVTAPFTGKVYEEHNHPDSWDLERLHNDLDGLISPEPPESYQVIIVEGVIVLWDDYIRSKLDLKLFVDCQADERIVRRIKRHLEWGDTFDAITSRYLDTVRYRHDEFVEPTKWHADLIINGSMPSDISLNVIMEWIRNQLGVEAD